MEMSQGTELPRNKKKSKNPRSWWATCIFKQQAATRGEPFFREDEVTDPGGEGGVPEKKFSWEWRSVHRVLYLRDQPKGPGQRDQGV